MDKKKTNFVVTDLDDTIWDWLTMWDRSFRPYFKRILNELQLDESKLLKSFKTLHRKYGTSESSFLYEKLDVLNEQQKQNFEISSADKKSIIHEYNANKKGNLKLYDGVVETMKKIRLSGAKIIGFTESNSFFTKYRIKHLNLDGLIDRIYAPADTGLPNDFIRFHSEDFWDTKITEFIYLKKDMRKPNPEILETILKDYKANKSTSIYIGDKLDRDIYMAQQCNITSVWAEYGLQTENEAYDLLRQVTHWTEKDVEREIEFRKNYKSNPQPDFILKKSFSELTSYFDFFTFEK